MSFQRWIDARRSIRFGRFYSWSDVNIVNGSLRPHVWRKAQDQCGNKNPENQSTLSRARFVSEREPVRTHVGIAVCGQERPPVPLMAAHKYLVTADPITAPSLRRQAFFLLRNDIFGGVHKHFLKLIREPDITI